MLEVLTMIPEEVVEKYDKEMDRRTRQNLERFAEFMARMIEKYGHKVLAEMEKEEMLYLHQSFYDGSNRRLQSGCTAGKTEKICRI